MAQLIYGKNVVKQLLSNPKKVHEVWTKEYGKSVEEIKTLNVYLKPEEAAAYYVINEETTGKVTI